MNKGIYEGKNFGEKNPENFVCKSRGKNLDLRPKFLVREFFWKINFDFYSQNLGYGF